MNLKTIVGSVVDRDRLLGSIYRELYVSDYFLRYISKAYDYSECKRKVEYIDRYYKDCEYEQLRRQIQYQADNPVSFDEFKIIYTNINNETYDYEESELYCTFRELTVNNYRNATKYKKLNDKYNVRKDNC